jgi:flagellar protein FliS
MADPRHSKTYLRTKIQTASKEELVLMLYDGVIRFTTQGKRAMEEGAVEDAHTAYLRAQDIVLELFHALDRESGGEIAENLARLYSYTYRALIRANINRDAEEAGSVVRIFRELREGWVGAMDKVRKGEGGEDSAADETTAAAGAAHPASPYGTLTAPESTSRISVRG